MGLRNATTETDDVNERYDNTDLADDIVDELVPGDLDWRRLVTTYPITSVSLASLAGFFLARNHGSTLLTGVSAFLAREMSRNILSVLDGELVDPVDADR